jgi:hypothetical protein
MNIASLSRERKNSVMEQTQVTPIDDAVHGVAADRETICSLGFCTCMMARGQLQQCAAKLEGGKFRDAALGFREHP